MSPANGAPELTGRSYKTNQAHFQNKLTNLAIFPKEQLSYKKQHQQIASINTNLIHIPYTIDIKTNTILHTTNYDKNYDQLSF